LNLTDADEQLRLQTMLEYEHQLWGEGCRYVAGLDEAGRGPLAGPVVAGAVVFANAPGIPLIDDSKKLSQRLREELFDKIRSEALSTGIGVVEVDMIDRINIYQASFLAMRKALQELVNKPDHLLVDGRAYPDESIPYTTLIKGDTICYSIASASILAKVTRDRLMLEYDRQYPQYGFASHKGYATRCHLEAIEQFGYTPIHRRSFHPRRFQLKLEF
jgi:ribonuclease HII